jgi:(R)-citramalate synthase
MHIRPLQFDFHAHNDYDLAIANVFHAIKAGITCIHTTINGLGERAGNAPLSSVIATIKDHLKMGTNVDESKLNMVSKLVESFSGIRIPTNKPLIGEFVFTQCSGVHADGDNKNNLYFNDLLPNVLDASANMPSAKLRAKPISKRIWKTSGSTSMPNR